MNTQKHGDNPFFRHWALPGRGAPFAEIRPEHFAPAYARAFAEHEAEVAAIAGRRAAVRQYHRGAGASGRPLGRVAVFHALAGAHTNDALLEIEREMSPQVAAALAQFHTGLTSSSAASML